MSFSLFYLPFTDTYIQSAVLVINNATNVQWNFAQGPNISHNVLLDYYPQI